MSRILAIALAVLFAFASAARADQYGALELMSKADFDALRTRMIEQLDNARDTDITPKDKATVIGALDRIGQHLAKPTKGDQDVVDIVNDQELINQITTHASAESRIVCKRDRPTGSHVMKITCMSLASWTEREKNDQKAMRAIVDDHRSHCPGCMFDSPTDPIPGIGH